MSLRESVCFLVFPRVFLEHFWVYLVCFPARVIEQIKDHSSCNEFAPRSCKNPRWGECVVLSLLVFTYKSGRGGRQEKAMTFQAQVFFCLLFLIKDLARNVIAFSRLSSLLAFSTTFIAGEMVYVQILEEWEKRVQRLFLGWVSVLSFCHPFQKTK